MAKDREINISKPKNIPESLKFWTGKKIPHRGLTWDEVARQVYDLTFMPSENWDYFQSLANRYSPLDHFVREARVFKEFDSKEKVRQYFEAELLKNQDPYHMIDMRIGMPGSGISTFYSRLLNIYNLTELSEEEKSKVAVLMLPWDEAAVDVICDEEAYFVKTKSGNPGTISELFGSMIASNVQVSLSPNLKQPKFRQQIMSALDYQGVLEGKYKRKSYKKFSRQDKLLDLLYLSQGEEKLDESFWQRLAVNPDFLFVVHEIAVKEAYSNSTDLFNQTMKYVWNLSQKGELHYKFAADRVIQTHFEGKTAADKFLADPNMLFQEVFSGSRSEVSEKYLFDYKQISEDSPEFLVLLDTEATGQVINARYGYVGKDYSEGIAQIDLSSDTIDGLEGKTGETLITMVKEFETFKSDYLSKLNSPRK